MSCSKIAKSRNFDFYAFFEPPVYYNAKDMTTVCARMRSFTAWPTNIRISVEKMSKSGLFYTGVQDKVKCFRCEKFINNWTLTDDPDKRHRDISPDCPYLNASASKRKSSVSGGTLVIKSNDDVTRFLSKVKGNQNSDLVTLRNHPGQRLNNEHMQPCCERFQNEAERLSSFQNWPKERVVSAGDLARAGWFYTGFADRTQCAYCRGVVHNWIAGDNAFVEHSRHFPSCQFAKDFGKKMLAALQSTVAIPQAATAKPAKIRDEAVAFVLGLGYEEENIPHALQVLQRTGKTISAINILEVLQNTSSSTDPTNAQFESSSDRFTAECEENCRSSTTSPAHQCVETQKTQNTDQLSEDFEENDAQKADDTQNGFQELNAVSAQHAHRETQTSLVNPDTTNVDLEEMKQFIEESKNTITCKVCLDSTVGVLFLPCRHLVCCGPCGAAVSKCPLCRTTIIGTIKAFL